MRFQALGLDEALTKAVREEGYTTPTPIQEQAIPKVLSGVDILGCAQTGTGKTAAFALPLLQMMMRQPPAPGHRPVRCLVLAPTRELADQIGKSFEVYGRHTGLRCTTVYGGVRQRSQVADLRAGVDVVVATPGRLMDLMGQGHVNLRHAQYLVLDEADRMLDMGFIDDIREIIRHVPKQRQTMLFSATLPYEIQHLADGILRDPVHVQVAPVATTAEGIDQFAYFVERIQKPHMLIEFLKTCGWERTLVFTRTKHSADRVASVLNKAGIRAEAMHGDLIQRDRDRAMEKFKSDAPPVMVATDIASRGLDIDEITHVVNYELPQEPDVYVHRIGRTGRAGATGTAVSFVDLEERSTLREIEKLTRQKIRVEDVPGTVPTLGQLLRGEVADAEGRKAAPVKEEEVVHKYGGFASHKHAPVRRRRKK